MAAPACRATSTGGSASGPGTQPWARSMNAQRLGIGAVLAWWMAGVASGAILTGIDALEAGGFAELQGKRIGLISHPSAVNRLGETTWRVLRRAKGVSLVALFGAEHGFDGKARAGTEIADGKEPETGLPVYSLYGPGPVRKPTASMLRGLDVLVYDIQDTGCRSYTFISTLGLAMEACAEAGVAFCVLDRPDPLGGIRVEGPQREERFKSFVGQWPIPYVYGMTPGELARMINGERWNRRACELSVVRMKGWNRSMTWKETGLKWVATSPNVPRGDSPLYLVATGILGEIGGLNLGTGSPDSFRVVGAPWLDATRLKRQLDAVKLPGIEFSPVELDLNRKAGDGREFKGVRLTLTDPARAPLVALNYQILEAVKKASGRDLFAQAAARGRSWEMFDKVSGTDQVRLALQKGRSAKQIIAAWNSGEAEFRRARAPYLLYTDRAEDRPPTKPPATSKSAKPSR